MIRTPMVERDCTIEHEGKKYESGGAWILRCTDGRWRGVVYADEKGRRVTTWHGETIAKAAFGPIYRGPFCNMRAISFTVDGRRFYGRYCPDWTQAVRVKSQRESP